MKTDYRELRAWIEERAVPDGQCWVWKLALKDGGQPQGKLRGQIINVRRELASHRAGRPIPAAWVAVCTCDTPGCVRPEHVVGRSRSEQFSGRRFTVAHKAALAKSARARARSGLTMERVQQLRLEPGTAVEKAQRAGIHVKYMRDILTGKVWKDYSSPFAGLLGGRAA